MKSGRLPKGTSAAVSVQGFLFPSNLPPPLFQATYTLPEPENCDSPPVKGTPLLYSNPFFCSSNIKLTKVPPQHFPESRRFPSLSGTRLYVTSTQPPTTVGCPTLKATLVIETATSPTDFSPQPSSGEPTAHLSRPLTPFQVHRTFSPFLVNQE